MKKPYEAKLESIIGPDAYSELQCLAQHCGLYNSTQWANYHLIRIRQHEPDWGYSSKSSSAAEGFALVNEGHPQNQI